MASSKNIGDQIFNAVQNAVDSQDFSNLQSTIEKSIGIAAEGIARGLSSASDGIRRGREQYALAQAKKRREEQMATIYANPSGQRSVGIALVGWGVVLGVPGLAGTIFTIGAGSILAGSILAAATVAGGALFAMGIKRLNLVNRFERYRDAIGLRDFCYLDEIAASTADTTETCANVRRCSRTGFQAGGARRRRNSWRLPRRLSRNTARQRARRLAKKTATSAARKSRDIRS